MVKKKVVKNPPDNLASMTKTMAMSTKAVIMIRMMNTITLTITIGKNAITHATHRTIRTTVLFNATYLPLI